MDTSIKVVGRVKPLGVDGGERALFVSSERELALHSSNGQFSTRQFRLNYIHDEDATQEEVFENIIPLLQNYLEGFNCTIFMCKK
jgi:hypothetical protein